MGGFFFWRIRQSILSSETILRVSVVQRNSRKKKEKELAVAYRTSRASIDIITLERERERLAGRDVVVVICSAMLYSTADCVCTIVNRCRALLLYFSFVRRIYLMLQQLLFFLVAVVIILAALGLFFLGVFLLHKLGSLKFWHVHVRTSRVCI